MGVASRFRLRVQVPGRARETRGRQPVMEHRGQLPPSACDLAGRRRGQCALSRSRPQPRGRPAHAGGGPANQGRRRGSGLPRPQLVVRRTVEPASAHDAHNGRWPGDPAKRECLCGCRQGRRQAGFPAPDLRAPRRPLRLHAGRDARRRAGDDRPSRHRALGRQSPGARGPQCNRAGPGRELQRDLRFRATGGLCRFRARAIPQAVSEGLTRAIESGSVIKFKGVLTPTPRGGGGTLVPIPEAVAARLGLKGMPKVQAVIAGTPYRGSLMPMGDGTYCLGVLKSIQEAAGVGQGDTISIEIELDTAPRTVAMPTDLAMALAHD
ncbi:MAG: DUF1905 domain-containing protein, partial [Chloroflexi bacterium]